MDQDNSRVQLRLTQQIWSCELDRDALRRLCELLDERVASAAVLEAQTYVRGAEQTEESYQQDRRRLLDAFRVTITVTGIDGKELFGTSRDVFTSPNFPEQIATFYVNSSVTLRSRYSYAPSNSMTVLLDFTRPHPLDFTVLPGHATQNNSHYVVDGADPSWTNGLFNELSRFFENRRARFPWLHRTSVYDAILWVVGIPLAFWTAFRISPFVEDHLAKYSHYLQIAAYLYVFAVSVIIFRVLFHYARWVWPRVEYVAPGSRSLAHRFVLGSLTLALLGTFLADLIKLVFR